MTIKKLDDGRYEVDMRPVGRAGRRIRRKFDRKNEAIAFERYVNANAKQKEWIGGDKDRRLLSELFELWWLYHGQNQKNAELVKTQLLKTIRDLDDVAASRLTVRSLMEYRSRRLIAGVQASTINRDLTRLSGMFSVLIKAGEYLGEHPVRGLERLKIKQTEMSFLSGDEISLLLSQLVGDYRRIAILCLSTGARWGEASQLKAEQLVNNRVTFLETKGSKKRIVPISQVVFDEVKTKESGRLFDASYYDFRLMIRAIKPDMPKGQASHVLRHTFASHFIMNGGNIIALQRILGHSTIQQTMTYAHFAPDYLQDAIALNPLSGSTEINQ